MWARSPYVSTGYAAGQDGPLRTAPDGWVSVGDRGTLTADGVLLVAGRGTDAVTTAGATVLVAEVEQALRRAGSGDVVVVGRPAPPPGTAGRRRRHRRGRPRRGPGRRVGPGRGPASAPVVPPGAVAADPGGEGRPRGRGSARRGRPADARPPVDRRLPTRSGAEWSTSVDRRPGRAGVSGAPVVVAALRSAIGTAGRSFAAVPAAELAAPVLAAVAAAVPEPRPRWCWATAPGPAATWPGSPR